MPSKFRKRWVSSISFAPSDARGSPPRRCPNPWGVNRPGTWKMTSVVGSVMQGNGKKLSVNHSRNIYWLIRNIGPQDRAQARWLKNPTTHWFCLRCAEQKTLESSLVGPPPYMAFHLCLQVNQCRWIPVLYPKWVIEEIDVLKRD